jgi:hypothetical protein
MRIGPLSCAAALTLIGAAAAQAETIYVTEPGYADPAYVEPGYVAAAPVEPGYVATAPSGYVYTEQAPFAEPRYVVTRRAPVVVRAPMVVTEPPTVIAEPAAPVELAPPVEVVTRPLAVAPRERFVERRVAPRRSGIVTTGYSASHSCFIDRNGFERCY